jgi:hypothetical protein
MKLIKFVLLGATMVAATTQAQTFDFDDLPTAAVTHTPIPNGYGGFDWNNFSALDGVADVLSGYHNGVVSTNNVAFNDGGKVADITSPTPFTLGSGFFIAAWNNGLSLEVQGFVGTTLVDDQTYTLNVRAPQFLVFNFTGITDARFISSGGTVAGLNGAGTQFALDNLTIVTVPEPSTLALGGLGVVVSFLFRRRK